MKLPKPSPVALSFASAVLFAAVALGAGAQAKKPHGHTAGGGMASGAVAAGKKVFESKGCVGCHAVKAGEHKAGGPDLAHIGSDKKWSAARLSAVVRDPKKTLHTSKMPAFGPDRISDAELKNLVAYLGSLK